MDKHGLSFSEPDAEVDSMAKAKRAAIYLRVFTGEQNVEDQRRDLEAAAAQRGWTIIGTYADKGISGSKRWDERASLDALLKDATRGSFDVVMCWAVDRIGRSLPDLLGTLQELHGAKVDLFLHQQAIDTTTPAGHALFGMAGVFAELERSMAQARIKAGLARARTNPRKGAKAIGRPKVANTKEEEIRSLLQAGTGVVKAARMVGVGTGTVQRIKAELRPKWTLNSLRPPTLADGPFPVSDFNNAVAADITAHLRSRTTPYFDDIARRYPTFPLQAELNHLCRAFNHEVLSALANTLRFSARGSVKRGRRKSPISAHSAPQGDSQVRVCAAPTKHFDTAVRKNPILPLRNELDRLCHTLPPEAVSALGDALRETVRAFVKRGIDTLEGLGGPSAHIRVAVQTRRNRGVSDAQIVREIEHLLPLGQSASSRRKRAERVVDGIPRSISSGPRFGIVVIQAFWAIARADRQLEAALKRGRLTEEEVEQRREERKSRFMSRAMGQHPR